MFIDCWLSDERRKLCICPADVFCSNTARALKVRFEITACASCMREKHCCMPYLCFWRLKKNGAKCGKVYMKEHS